MAALAVFRYKSEYKKVGVLPIWKANRQNINFLYFDFHSRVSSVGYFTVTGVEQLTTLDLEFKPNIFFKARL